MRKLTVGILAGTVVALCAPAAASAQPACGDVLTKDTTLTADLTCSLDGLVIGKSGITLDLGGHTLSGEGPPQGTAISNDGHNRVVVRNGTISGLFGRAFAFNQVSRSRITGITLDGALERDLSWTGGTGNVVSHNQFGAGLSGSFFTDVHRSRIADNNLSGNFNALTLSGATHNVVSANELRTAGRSIALTAGSDNNLLAGNDAGDALQGNPVSDSSRNVFYDNQLRDVSVQGASDRNVYVGNTAFTLGGPSRAAIEIVSGTNTVALRNTTEGGYGVRVGAAAVGTKVVRNTTNDGTSASGIDVRAPGTLIRGNTANNNGLYGIFAVPGAIDGGGNHASGNGQPEQCVGVVCKP